jgi:hypothetical protein
LGFTPSWDNTCPKKFISRLANLIFTQLVYTLFFLNFCTQTLNVSHVLS